MSRPKFKKVSSRLNGKKQIKNHLHTIIEQSDLNINDIIASCIETSNEPNTPEIIDLKEHSNTKTAETQTIDPYSFYKSSVEDFSYDNISDLCSIFINSISSWNGINYRTFIVIIYLILSKCKIRHENYHLNIKQKSSGVLKTTAN